MEPPPMIRTRCFKFAIEERKTGGNGNNRGTAGDDRGRLTACLRQFQYLGTGVTGGATLLRSRLKTGLSSCGGSAGPSPSRSCNYLMSIRPAHELVNEVSNRGQHDK